MSPARAPRADGTVLNGTAVASAVSTICRGRPGASCPLRIYLDNHFGYEEQNRRAMP
jgi:hypothetical protein